ncbi:hypothetical protein RchiOBHm_Chr6g0268251 [Rosa chinensis]|uniref:Uncharacterized protein n=1 Tax=Rosa chinensis TaxID=74649 RepID=A0A2P6PQ60_ROSCH|nr:hypothetical protein RchiOBHm_Chr6g0268251 [Rosa chinensis]
MQKEMPWKVHTSCLMKCLREMSSLGVRCAFRGSSNWHEDVPNSGHSLQSDVQSVLLKLALI